MGIVFTEKETLIDVLEMIYSSASYNKCDEYNRAVQPLVDHIKKLIGNPNWESLDVTDYINTFFKNGSGKELTFTKAEEDYKKKILNEVIDNMWESWESYNTEVYYNVTTTLADDIEKVLATPNIQFKQVKDFVWVVRTRSIHD